jgi:hypothetical protein
VISFDDYAGNTLLLASIEVDVQRKDSFQLKKLDHSSSFPLESSLDRRSRADAQPRAFQPPGPF